jgi:multiple antibiotic resistance protein
MMTTARAMTDLLTFALLCFTSLFTMINPVGVIPVYMALVRDLDPALARRVAIKAVLFSFVILLIFALGGNAIFHFFQIRIDSLKVVGGVLFFMLGFDMLQVRMERPKKPEETLNQFADDIAITPLAIPFICGPGAITMVILLYRDAPNLQSRMVFLLVLVLVVSLTGLILLGGRTILNALGPSGTKVMMRIMGLIVMVIAVEFFFSGLTPIVRDMLLLEAGAPPG